MKKLMIFAIAAVMCAAMVSQADAQPTFRVGGGLIFDGTVWGGGAAVDMPLGDRPFGLGLSTEYYKKSGVTFMPVRVLAMIKNPAGDQADFYAGVGSGIYYSKVSVAGFSASTTKALATGVAGINFRATESFGVYGEVGYDRALTSGASNDISARVGISFGGGR